MTCRARLPIALVVASLAPATAAAAAVQRTVAAHPSHVRAGGSVTFSGTGWPAHAAVVLLIGPPRSEASRFSSARTDGAGRFSRRVKLSSRARPGHYVVLACRRSCRDKASTRLTITAARRAVTAAAAPKNKIKVDIPATVKAGKSFLAEAAAQLDPRSHRPPYDYLKAALLYTPGTRSCPKAVPLDRKGWQTVATYDYGQSGSVNVGFGTSLTLAKGRYRFCAYIYVDSYSYKNLMVPARHTKKVASKLVRAR